MAIAESKPPSYRTGWYGRDLTKPDLTIDLGAAQIAALERLAGQARAQGLPLAELERRHFDDPALNGFLAAVREEIVGGRGIVVLRGFPVDRLAPEDIEYFYMGLGTHFGRICSQSSAGDVLGIVTDRNSTRGYASNRELALHSDPAELVGLLCIRRAREGGESVYASSLAIHDIVRREHPEYLPVLERGFPYHRRGEEAPGDEPITPYDVPVYSTAEGVLSCRYAREVFEVALRDLGRALTPFEAAALDFFEAVAMRDAVRFELRMEPGEAVFVNNYELLHARTPFVDWDDPGQKRLLFRLWLESIPPRPIRREMRSFQNKSGRQGIDGQAGRMPGLAQYVPPDTANQAIRRR